MTFPPAAAYLVSQSVSSCSVAAPKLLDGHRTGLVGVEVHVEVHGTSTHAGCCVAAGQEVEGVLGVGEDPDSPGPAHIQLVRVTQGTEFVGEAADGLVEQQRVGGVQGHHEVGGGGVAAVA